MPESKNQTQKVQVGEESPLLQFEERFEDPRGSTYHAATGRNMSLDTMEMATAKQVNVQTMERAPLIDPRQAEASIWPGMELLPVASVVGVENFHIEGSDFSQLLQVRLMPGQIITAEPGTMVLMSEGLTPSVDVGDCGQGCTRMCCAGENFFRLVFHNKTNQPQMLGLTPMGPGKIIPIDLREFSGITIKSGAFLAAEGKDWTISLHVVRNVVTGCCGGQGFILNRLNGSGMAFISASGTVEKIMLKEDEEYLVDTNSLVAFQQGVHYTVRSTGCCSLLCCCGGMGLFNVLLRGPGMVLVETMPIEKLRRAIGVRNGGGGNNGGDGGSS